MPCGCTPKRPDPVLLHGPASCSADRSLALTGSPAAGVRDGPLTAATTRLGVLRLAVAEGPVLLLYLNRADDDVFAAQPDPLVQAVCYRLVKILLGSHVPPLVEDHPSGSVVEQPQAGSYERHSVLGARSSDLS